RVLFRSTGVAPALALRSRVIEPAPEGLARYEWIASRGIPPPGHCDNGITGPGASGSAASNDGAGSMPSTDRHTASSAVFGNSPTSTAAASASGIAVSPSASTGARTNGAAGDGPLPSSRVENQAIP